MSYPYHKKTHTSYSLTENIKLLLSLEKNSLQELKIKKLHYPLRSDDEELRRVGLCDWTNPHLCTTLLCGGPHYVHGRSPSVFTFFAPQNWIAQLLQSNDLCVSKIIEKNWIRVTIGRWCKG